MDDLPLELGSKMRSTSQSEKEAIGNAHKNSIPKWLMKIALSINILSVIGALSLPFVTDNRPKFPFLELLGMLAFIALSALLVTLVFFIWRGWERGLQIRKIEIMIMLFATIGTIMFLLLFIS